MAGGTEFNSGKFNELVLLMVERSGADPRLSRVKLNKLLYYADFEAYRRLGRSISGATYVKGEHGPMAAELPRAEKELGQRGYLTWRREEAGPYTQKIPVATEGADERQFSTDELAIVAEAVAALLPLGGKGASEWSHEESVGWNVADEEGEPIPYHATFISAEPIPPEDLERAKQYVRERGWVKKTA